MYYIKITDQYGETLIKEEGVFANDQEAKNRAKELISWFAPTFTVKVKIEKMDSRGGLGYILVSYTTIDALVFIRFE